MMLIKNGANANVVDSYGMNALHIAAMEGLPRIVEKILEDPKINIDLQDKKFNTALHYASAEDNFECCKILLSRNASPDMVNDEGETPLHIAARENCIDIVNALIDCKKRKKMESGGMYTFIMECREVRHWNINRFNEEISLLTGIFQYIVNSLSCPLSIKSPSPIRPPFRSRKFIKPPQKT